ncbi:MAG: hypothetical protein HY077_07420 [Elusimicrobia bacterium]|nr:hypothetical protein [Elusimicrobiota bacterium]
MSAPGSVARFLLLAGIKAVSRAFYAFDWEWVGRRPPHPFRDVRIGILLNHTSLFEPILLGFLPFGFLWEVAKRGLMPGADITMSRPIAGKLFSFMVADAVSITRARDASWRNFTSRITEDAVVVMSPEGRMKRRTGLDKFGKPMSVRGGIGDVLDRKTEGTMLIIYSEGLHHLQAPGEGFPNLFQRVRARLEEVPIERYKKALGHGTHDFRANVMADLDRRRDLHCPWA